MPRLAELNQYVPVKESAGNLTPDYAAQFGIVVLTGVPLEQVLHTAALCRRPVLAL